MHAFATRGYGQQCPSESIVISGAAAGVNPESIKLVSGNYLPSANFFAQSIFRTSSTHFDLDSLQTFRQQSIFSHSDVRFYF